MNPVDVAKEVSMNHRLILIEGIPGSGKTTLSARLETWLQEQEIKTMLYREGDAHPADMAWNALLTRDEMDEVKKNHPRLIPKLDDLTRQDGDQFILAYTKIGYEAMGSELQEFFASHEVYDGRVPLEVFEGLHRRRWAEFAGLAMDHPDTVYLFECSFLQNHVNELLTAHNKSEAEILAYLNALAAPVMPLNPILLYLDQPDPDETIRRVAAERVNPPESGRPDWIQLVIRYVEDSQYGRTHGLNGLDGALHLIRERKKIEMAVWPDLKMDRAIIPNPDYDWDAVFHEMTRAVRGQEL